MADPMLVECLEDIVSQARSANVDRRSDEMIAVCDLCGGVDGDHEGKCPIPAITAFLIEQGR